MCSSAASRRGILKSMNACWDRVRTVASVPERLTAAEFKPYNPHRRRPRDGARAERAFGADMAENTEGDTRWCF